MKKPHFNLRTKLVCYFILGFVIPIIVFGILLISLQQRNSEKFMVESQETSALQLADHISQELRSIQNLSNLYYLNDDLVSLLTQESPARDEALREQLKELERLYGASLGKINADISIIDSSGEYVSASSAKRPDTALLASLARRQVNLTWFTSYDVGLGDGSGCNLYAYRPLHDRETWEQVGALLITIKAHELRKIYSGYLSEEQNAYLIDNQGRQVSSVDNQNVSYTIPGRILPLYSGTFRDQANGVPQLVTFYSVQMAGLQLVLVSDLDMMRSPYRQTTLIFLGILLLYVILVLCVTYIVPKSFVRPIHELQKNIALVKQGNLDTMVPVKSSDEIGQLSEQYNDMLRRLRELLQGLMEAQQAQHKAEMHALQAQINPHFIYNSLASIRFLVISSQNTEADSALVSLISILRGTLSNPHDFSTVGQELKLLQDYIALQRIAFSHKLHVSFQVDESVRSCRICKLTLQPIVENAFTHAFSGGQEDCSLWISAADRGDCVEIVIRDNGCGFDPNAPKRASASDGLPHSGLGVANVHERLRLAFGPEAGVRIESQPGVGTVATVTIPKQQTQGGTLVYDSSDR